MSGTYCYDTYVQLRTYCTYIFLMRRVYFVRIDQRDRYVCRYNIVMYVFSTRRTALFDGVCMSKLEKVSSSTFLTLRRANR